MTLNQLGMIYCFIVFSVAAAIVQFGGASWASAAASAANAVNGWGLAYFLVYMVAEAVFGLISLYLQHRQQTRT